MECRVGITQNPDEALSRWKKKHPTLRGWETLGEFSSKGEARLKSKLHAQERGCVICPEEGGSGEDPWFVYCFTFGEVAMEVGLRDIEGEVCTVKSMQQLKTLLEGERKFWTAQRDKVLKSENVTAHRYFECTVRLESHIAEIEQFTQISSSISNNDFTQQAKNRVANICGTISQHWIWSGRPYVSMYVKCNIQHDHGAADAFINYILKRSFSMQDRAGFLGVMHGYEFLYYDENAGSRHDGEERSLNKLRRQFQNEIVEFQTQGSKCKNAFTAWDAEAREKTNNLHSEIQGKGNDQVRQHSERFEENMRQWEKSMKGLESLYEEKLRLQKPAKYWKDAAEKYKRQGIRWTLGTVIFSVAGLAGLGISFYLWLSGYSAQLKLDTLQGAVIFASLMAVFAFVLRVLARLSFSAFHLMRDAEEREQLTYLYLSLSEKVPEEKESRDIILRALFSRSQTGLLANERGPTMPADLMKRGE